MPLIETQKQNRAVFDLFLQIFTYMTQLMS
jgi:hypothetical protein